MNGVKFARYVLVMLLFGLSMYVSYALFSGEKTSSKQPTSRTSELRDALSGAYYNPATFKNSADTNPHLPSYVGYEALVKNGVSNDEIRYIQDFTSNYILYNKQSRSALISYVADSYAWHGYKGNLTTYDFKFGINGSNVHTLSVSYDDIKSTITMTISKNTSVIDKKTFTVHTEVD